MLQLPIKESAHKNNDDDQEFTRTNTIHQQRILSKLNFVWIHLPSFKQEEESRNSCFSTFPTFLRRQRRQQKRIDNSIKSSEKLTLDKIFVVSSWISLYLFLQFWKTFGGFSEGFKEGQQETEASIGIESATASAACYRDNKHTTKTEFNRAAAAAAESAAANAFPVFGTHQTEPGMGARAWWWSGLAVEAESVANWNAAKVYRTHTR